MEPSNPDKPTEPVVSAVPTADTSRLFQKDAVPVFPRPKQRLIARLIKHKLLFIGLVLSVSILIGGLTYAQLRNSSGKLPTVQPATANQSGAGADNTKNGEIPQNTSGQTPSPGGSSTPSITTTQSSTGGASSSSPPPGGGTASTTPKTYGITYTNSCYSPANLAINKNDTVQFTNTSTKNMWPASNNHPSHTLYPEFDANKNIVPGGTYSFTFAKVGLWGYHDHLKPSCTGTITVQ
jgi:plastocyanin